MSIPVSPLRQGYLRQRYPGTNLRMKPHSPTEDFFSKRQLQPPSPVNRAKARLPSQQSTEHNNNSKHHSPATRRVALPSRSACPAPPGPGRGDDSAGRCPRERSRSGEALQRPPRLCRAAPPAGGPGGRAPPGADVAVAGRDAPLPARCSRAPAPVPVTPDAVEQLHEGEGEVEAEEGEEVAGSLVRQDRPAQGAHRGLPAAGAAPGGRTRSPGGPGASAPAGTALTRELGRGAGSARPGPPRATHLNQPDTFLSRLSLGGLYSSSLMERGSIFPAAEPRRAGPAGRAGGSGALPSRPSRRFRPPARLRRRAPGLRGRAGGRAGAAGAARARGCAAR